MDTASTSATVLEYDADVSVLMDISWEKMDDNASLKVAMLTNPTGPDVEM